MGRPNVTIVLGNGNLGRVSGTSDGVSGLILTGSAVEDKLEINKVYTLTSVNDLVALGVTEENNYLINKDVRAFFSQKTSTSELYLIVVSEATTLKSMCEQDESAPLPKLIAAGGGRIRLVGCNKIAPEGYQPSLDAEIDKDAIDAATTAQATAELLAAKVRPFRVLMPAPAWTGNTENMFKPRESSTNRVSFVLASDDETKHSSAIGQVVGRLANIAVNRSPGRVANGAIATNGWATNGQNYKELDGIGDLLHDAGYIIYMGYPTKNGCYLNGDPSAAPLSDDYSSIRNGRVVDKASVICYTTYIDSILDDMEVDDNGKIPTGACLSYESMLERAVLNQMRDEISAFDVAIDPDQDIISTEHMDVSAEITPKSVLGSIKVNLSLVNPKNS